MTFSVSDLTPRIGAKIEADIATLTSGERAQEVREILDRRGVIVFPKIHMSDAEQLAFAHTLGNVVKLHGEETFKVTLDSKVNPAAEYLKGTVLWHFDGWADDVPARGSILSARVLSPTGGQTEFANTYAAYDALPAEKKRLVDGLTSVHTMAATQRRVYPDASAQMRADWESRPVKRHPLVWTHQSGRKSLLLGYNNDHIEGWDVEEGRAFIQGLIDWTSQPQFVYRHEWEVGDMVMWDNCGLMHRVMPYRADSGRLMHRVTLEGEEAVA